MYAKFIIYMNCVYIKSRVRLSNLVKITAVDLIITLYAAVIC